MMANCLVLGGNGLIGSAIAERLVAEGFGVRAFDLFKGKDNLQEIRPKIEKMNGDYLNESDVRKALHGIELVFHCIHSTVPRSSIERPLFDAETNILPAITLLSEAVKAKTKKIIYLSSLAVYGNPSGTKVLETDSLQPISPHGVSKLAIEKYIEYFNRAYGMDYAILRPATTYGEKQRVSPDAGVVANFIYNALTKKPLVIYGDGSAVRDILHAQDLADAAVKAALKKADCRLFNLGSGKGITLNELAEKVARATGSRLQKKHIEKDSGIQELVCDVTRAGQVLGWRPQISLDEGIKRCVGSFRKELRLH